MDLIDVHAHIVPQRLPDGPAAGVEPRWPCVQCADGIQATVTIQGKPFREIDHRSWDSGKRMADMDAAGVSRQALSPMPELLSYWFDPAAGLEMCRAVNQTIADMMAANPARFSGLGCVPLQDPALAAAELSRVKADGFAGVEIGSNINGVLPGDERFEEFFAEAQALGLSVFVHALHPIGADRLHATPDLIPFAAFPLDTGLAAVSLVRAGIPERYPGLKLGFSHGGGAIVPLVHRLAKGWELTNGFGGLVPKTPQHYTSGFYYDNLVYDAGYLAYLVREFAPDRVFSGTDYPYAIMEVDPSGFIDAADIADDASLRHGAASRFLGLANEWSETGV
ncbi:MAG: amidohydrolase [Gammaproteobacteria bacterium]|nr:amidohydrolase [Gammaproteobacteria bacterium]